MVGSGVAFTMLMQPFCEYLTYKLVDLNDNTKAIIEKFAKKLLAQLYFLFIRDVQTEIYGSLYFWSIYSCIEHIYHSWPQ